MTLTFSGCNLYALFLQIFVGKIPRDLFEDELVPLFEKAGSIWDLRLMMDPLTGLNRGYAFITFCTKDAAQEAVKLVSGSHGCSLLFCWSVADALAVVKCVHVAHCHQMSSFQVDLVEAVNSVYVSGLTFSLLSKV